MFYEKNIRSSFHISNVEDLNDGDIKEMNSIHISNVEDLNDGDIKEMNSIIKKEFSDDE